MERLTDDQVEAIMAALTVGDVWANRAMEDVQERGLRTVHRAASREGLADGDFEAFLDRLPAGAFKNAQAVVANPPQPAPQPAEKEDT